jgi:biopolymer transport protein ExbB/TolQ
MTSIFIRGGWLVLGAVLCLAPVAPQAKAQDANRDTVYTSSSVGDIVERIARRSGPFKEDFDKAVEKSIIDGTKLEDKAKHRADDLHDNAKKLKDLFGEKRDKADPKVRDQVDRTLSTASDLNRVMVEFRFTEKLQRDWDQLKGDLNALAAVYSLSPM